MSHEDEYYWCLRHHRVETYDQCRAGDRLGPYPSAAAAADALETAEQRNEDWENDPRFNDEDEDPDAEDDDTEGWGPFKH